MENQFYFSTRDPDVYFAYLLQGPEHVGSHLFAGLEKIPLHTEEDTSGIEQRLDAGEAEATTRVAQPLEREDVRAPTKCGAGEEEATHRDS